MKDHSRTRERLLNRTALRISALFLSAVVLAACSGNLREVTNQPPQASLDGLEKTSDGVIVALGLRNVNDEPLQLDGISITLTLDDEPLAVGDRHLPLIISSRGREVLRFTLSAEPAGLQRLNNLAAGDVARLPWSLEARLTLNGSTKRRTSANGWIHPVPGQPDRFR